MASCSGDATYGGALGGVASVLDSGIDGILSSIANAILSAAVSLFADVAKNIPTTTDASVNGKIGLQIRWLVIALAVASLLFASARMALERRAQPGTMAVKGILRMILVAGAATYVINALAALTDRYTTHLYESGVKEQLKLIAQCGTDSLTAFLLIIVGLLLIIAGIIHIILLYIRLGVMVILSGTLPLAAAASMTEWGSSWWRKHIAWMVAWLVFKPATGLVLYAGAAMITSSGADSTQQKIAGCGVLLLSAVALPALLRLVVPAAAALGASDGMSGAAAGAASGAAKATGAVATGAAGLAARGRGAGGGAGSGKSAPSGAASASGSSGSKASGPDSTKSGGASGDSDAGSDAGGSDSASGSDTASSDTASIGGGSTSGGSNAGSPSGSSDAGSDVGSASGGASDAEGASGSGGGSDSGSVGGRSVRRRAVSGAGRGLAASTAVTAGGAWVSATAAEYGAPVIDGALPNGPDGSGH